MTRATQTLTRTEELLKQAGNDPQTALELAIAENERMRRDAEVEWGPDGIKHANLASLYRLAQFFSSATMVPDHFKGKPADCFIACQLAMRLGCDIFMLMQHLYVVHGKPGIEAKLAIGLANASGKFKGPIRWEEPTGTIKGKDRRWVAYAYDKETGEKLTQELTWSDVEAEGWVGKSGSKWKSIPELMAKYRSAMWLIRTYCPEVIMGLQSTDELADAGPAIPAVPSNVDLEAVEALLASTPQKDDAKDSPPPEGDTKPVAESDGTLFDDEEMPDDVREAYYEAGA